MNTVRAGRLTLGGRRAPLFIIAGPCVIETEKTTLQTAETLAEICDDLGLPFIFKASYDKANRTARDSFRGPGLKRGLAVLAKVKKRFGLPILMDVHEILHCKPAAEIADVLQIPAFLCRQTDLIQAAARTKRCVNVKKGQFLAPWDMANVIDKIAAVGGRNILLTERGSSFGYNNLVADMRSLAILREFGWPVVFDATHSVQMPGGGQGGKSTGGDRRMAPVLARAAVAAGCDGVFFEAHPNPDHALSDAASQLPLGGVKALLETLRDIHAIAKQAWLPA
ncbi:MAG TPA: 3-deoxy-8-phosphooctulonate synthase [Verrucomicrobiae bacterium]|nr:3-deoxy-8-phosphooctulonate synthase [Verrucomicrobiae bacterium]